MAWVWVRPREERSFFQVTVSTESLPHPILIRSKSHLLSVSHHEDLYGVCVCVGGGGGAPLLCCSRHWSSSPTARLSADAAAAVDGPLHPWRLLLFTTAATDNPPRPRGWSDPSWARWQEDSLPWPQGDLLNDGSSGNSGVLLCVILIFSLCVDSGMASNVDFVIVFLGWWDDGDLSGDRELLEAST